MAQSKIEITKGQNPDLFTTGTDATSLTSGVGLTCIFATGVTRDEAAQFLSDARLRVLDGIHTTIFPT